MRGEQRHKLETDALILRVEQAVDWARENRRSLVTIVAATVGVALLAGGFLVNRGNRKEAARTRLGVLTAEIQQVMGGEEGQRGPCEASLSELVRLADSEGNSVEGRTARYYAGVCQRALGDYEEAAASFERIRGRRDLLAELATLGLAGVQRTSGKGEEAALAYRSLLDGGGELPLDPVLFELGVLEEEQGRPEAASDLYERIVEEYPASAFRDLAETRRERLPDPSR
jgi:tetratricopeptide (TPR) repeat protein